MKINEVVAKSNAVEHGLQHGMAASQSRISLAVELMRGLHRAKDAAWRNSAHRNTAYNYVAAWNPTALSVNGRAQ